MHRRRNILAVCFIASLWPASDTVHAQTLDTLGLPSAFGDGLKAQVPAEIQPGPIPQDRRVLHEPIVNRNSIGLQNTAGRPLTFRIEIAGQLRDLTLAPQEIMTLEIGQASGAKVTIGSGDKFTTTLLAKGQIYVLKAEGDEWVFSGL
jgi:hypothetical protein